MIGHGDILAAALALAQANGWDAMRIFWAVLALTVAVIVLAVVALLVRRRLLAQDEPGQGPGFTLASLRALRDAGELSEAEYERARSALIGQIRLRDDEAAAKTQRARPSPAADGTGPSEGPSGEPSGGPTEPDEPDSGKPA